MLIEGKLSYKMCTFYRRKVRVKTMKERV